MNMLRFIQEQVRAVNGPNIHARVDGAKTLGVAWLNTPETLSRQGRRGEVVSLPAFVLAHGIRVLLVPSALVGRWTVQFTLWSSDRVNDNPTPLAATNGERGSHQGLGRLYLQLILQRMPSLMAED